MPWWSWPLLWTVLVLGLVSVLGWFTVALYRKALATLRALEALSNQVSAVNLNLPPDVVPFNPAVFADATKLLQNVEQGRLERTNQRQVRRDRWIVRGKLMRNAR